MGGEFNIGLIQVSDQYINIHTHNMSPSHRNGFNVLNLPLEFLKAAALYRLL